MVAVKKESSAQTMDAGVRPMDGIRTEPRSAQPPHGSPMGSPHLGSPHMTVPASSGPPPAMPNKVVIGPPVLVGQAVQARRGGGQQWVPGHIARIQGGGVCSVHFDDGVTEDNVPWAYIRMPQSTLPAAVPAMQPQPATVQAPQPQMAARQISLNGGLSRPPMSGVQVPISFTQRANSLQSPSGSACVPSSSPPPIDHSVESLAKAAPVRISVPVVQSTPHQPAAHQPEPMPQVHLHNPFASVEPMPQPQPQQTLPQQPQQMQPVPIQVQVHQPPVQRGISGPSATMETSRVPDIAPLHPLEFSLQMPLGHFTNTSPPPSPPAPEAPIPVPPPSISELDKKRAAFERNSDSGEESDDSTGSKCDRTKPSSWWKPQHWIRLAKDPTDLLLNVKSSLTTMVENLTEVQVDMDFTPLQNSKPPPALNSISNEYSEDAIRTATRDFDKKNLLGSGACGSVYKGVMADGTEVAVKVLYLNDFSGFEDEVRVLSRFRHPNLVILMGFSRHADTGARSLVYEYLSGGDLSGQLKASRKGERSFPAAKRLAVALDAASGLSHMHNARPRAFHRDIKSANILLDKNGTAKMADFGLARVSSSAQHKVSAASGTPGYACPEYLRTGVVTEGSEAHSFGMVLLELLTGVPPAVVTPNGPEKLLFPFKHLDRSAEKAVAMEDGSAHWEEPVARAVAELAFHCIDPKPEMRPRFTHLVEILRWMQDPASQVNPESLKEMINLVSPSCPKPLPATVEEQPVRAKEEAREVQELPRQQTPPSGSAGCLRCLHAQGVDLSHLSRELLEIPLPGVGEECPVGRNRQSHAMWSRLVPDESLKGMISREHFKVIGQFEMEPGEVHKARTFYVCCLSSNGMILNSDTIRREDPPRKLQHGDVLGFIDAKDPVGSEHMPFLAFEFSLLEGDNRTHREEPRATLPNNALATLEVKGPHTEAHLSREERLLFLCGDHCAQGGPTIRIGRDRQGSFWKKVLRPDYYLGGSWAFMAKEHFEVVAQQVGSEWRFIVRVLALTGLTINHSVVYACGNEQELKSGDVLTVDASEMGENPAGASVEQRGLHFAFSVVQGYRPSGVAQAAPSRPASRAVKPAPTVGDDPSPQEWKNKVPPLRLPSVSQPFGWEVRTDTGWEPWIPGVAFVGRPGEEIRFTLGTFLYKAVFHSTNDGVQVNTVTNHERPLRRVKSEAERAYEAAAELPVSEEKAAIITRLLRRGLTTGEVAAIADVPETHVSAVAAYQSDMDSSYTGESSSVVSAAVAQGFKGRAAGVLQAPVAFEAEE